MATVTGHAAEPDVEQSVTASEYIQRQLELEKQAREIMPYSFETCTYSMGPLRQPVTPPTIRSSDFPANPTLKPRSMLAQGTLLKELPCATPAPFPAMVTVT